MATLDSLAWALPAALSAAHGEREQAQGAIQACALLPGYCTRLLQLTAAFELGDSARLLAATQLKNEILRRWCAGPRGIPEAERPVLREGLLARLATDEPCEQVGLQIGMTVARIMRSEANRGLGTVLQAFLDAMLQRQHLPPHALLALLHTAKELGTMRLPAQKLLAARVARLLLPSLSQQWSAALHAAMQPASDVRSVAAATLFTKVVRQLHDRIAAVAARPEAEAEAEQQRQQQQQQLAETAQLVLAAAPLVQQRCAASGAGAAWVRLGGALGKLLGALAARDTRGGEGGEGSEDGESEEDGEGAAGADDGGFPWGEAARVCWGVLLLEAEGRQRLLAAASPHGGQGGEGGKGGEGAALAALAARERGASALPTHCARLLERGTAGRAAVAAAVAAPLGARPELLPALLSLMALPAAQLAEWEADAEEFACGLLLPPLEPLDAGPGEEGDDDDDDDSGGDEGAEEEEEGGACFDEADASLAGAAANVGGHAHRLQQAAETLLVALLWCHPPTNLPPASHLPPRASCLLSPPPSPRPRPSSAPRLSPNHARPQVVPRSRAPPGAAAAHRAMHRRRAAAAAVAARGELCRARAVRVPAAGHLRLRHPPRRLPARGECARNRCRPHRRRHTSRRAAAEWLAAGAAVLAALVLVGLWRGR